MHATMATAFDKGDGVRPCIKSSQLGEACTAAYMLATFYPDVRLAAEECQLLSSLEV